MSESILVLTKCLGWGGKQHVQPLASGIVAALALEKSYRPILADLAESSPLTTPPPTGTFAVSSL